MNARCSSASSRDYFRVEVFEFDSGVVGGELPVDAGLMVDADRCPGLGFLANRFGLGDPTVEALAGEHAQFALGDVQPRPVFGGVDQLDPVGDPQGFFGIECQV